MNESTNFDHPIKFKGKVYQSLAEMPPEDRALLERLRAKVAQSHPGENLDQSVADRLNQEDAFANALKSHAGPARAWGGGAETPAVPNGFEPVTNLGKVVNSYLAKKDTQLYNLLFGVPLFTGGGILDLLALGALLFPGHFLEPKNITGTAIFGTILLFLGAWLLNFPVRRLLNRDLAINALVIYRDGFAYRTHKNIHIIPWTAMASIFSDVTQRTGRNISYEDAYYTFILKNGEKIVLDNNQFAEAPGITKAIKKNVNGVLLPPLQAAYQAGSTLTFGPVNIAQASGIQAHGRQFAWNTVYRVEVKQGRLKIVTKDEKSFDIRAKLIPNIEVLCELIGIDPFTIELTYY